MLYKTCNMHARHVEVCIIIENEIGFGVGGGGGGGFYLSVSLTIIASYQELSFPVRRAMPAYRRAWGAKG